MLGRIFSWLSPLQSLELSGVNPINNELFGICTSPIIHFVCHPKFFAQLLFSISPGYDSRPKINWGHQEWNMGDAQMSIESVGRESYHKYGVDSGTQLTSYQ